MLNSPYNKPRITPPSEHPRLLFKETDRARIESGLTDVENKRAYELWRRVCKKDFRHFYDDIKAGKYNLMVCFMIESKALEAWLEKDEEKARELIDTVIKIIDLYQSDRNKNLMLCRFTGHLVYVTSCMYDWLYQYLTDGEKAHIISRCEELLSGGMEMGYPPTRQRDIHSHAHEMQLLRDMISFAIAVYDERPDIYDYCAGRIFDDYVPFYRFSFSSGISNQGAAYGAYRHCAPLWCQLIFYAMSGERIFDKCVEDASDCYYYITRADGENLRLGNDCNDDKGGGLSIKHPFTVVSFLAGAVTGNETYRRYYFENFHDEQMLPTVYDIGLYKYSTYGEGMLSPVTHLVFNRIVPTFEPKPYEKTRYFPYPSGITVYKDEEKGTTVYMKIGELWSQGHEHYDTGDFQIYHNGILASSSGSYHVYGNNHYYNYLTRTAAHNCLTVLDPSVTTLGTRELYPEGTTELINDGGTRMPSPTTDYNKEPDLATAWQRDMQMARVISHTEGDDLVELAGDLTEAYSHTCERVIRKMTFEPNEGECGVFTVSDEVVARSEDFIKCFHLHTMAEPVIEGNMITVEYKGGRLTCTVIEPENADIKAIGGGDMRFTVNGAPVPCDETENRECGWGQVMITPTDRSKEHHFKVRMEIGDASL